MPDMSGYALVERLTELRGGVKVLFMSGYTDVGRLQRGLADGRMAFLQKPFSPQALSEKIRRVLDETVAEG